MQNGKGGSSDQRETAVYQEGSYSYVLKICFKETIRDRRNSEVSSVRTEKTKPMQTQFLLELAESNLPWTF